MTTAQQLLDRLRDNAKPAGCQELAALTGSGTEALAVLAALHSCGADPGSLEIVAAAVLSGLDDTVTGPEVDGWWAWLSRRRFEAGDFAAAAALRQAIPPAAAQPRLALAVVAARRGTEAVATAIGDAILLEDLSQAESQSLLVTAVHELLRQGGAEFAGAIEIAAAAVSAPWSVAARIAVRWWDKAMRPLPLERLRLGEEQRIDAAQIADEWAALDRPAEKLRAVLPALHGWQRYAPVPAARRRPAQPAGNGHEEPGPRRCPDLDGRSEACRRWRLGRRGQQGGWLHDLIHGHLRPPFVDRITGIISAARAVAGHDEPAGAQGEPFDETIDAARERVRNLCAALPALQRGSCRDGPARAGAGPRRCAGSRAAWRGRRRHDGTRDGTGRPGAVAISRAGGGLRWSEAVTGRERARLVARGIADRHTPDSTVRDWSRTVSSRSLRPAGRHRPERAGPITRADRLARVIESRRKRARIAPPSQALAAAGTRRADRPRQIDVAAVVADAGGAPTRWRTWTS